ncbi:hypothetical protein K490DRAFT_53203 [Saccharata proteae CBS 121410]|uniref:F-box domain-containing protein n=1 Tax=Saccharata proteae CBS 121410 TaxID=1314787 RepID=A0A9P4I2Y5_9PEZI|nr:hypothetical protein K490DRAFT_53203 [Saccharata proteae CBS 121410]
MARHIKLRLTMRRSTTPHLSALPTELLEEITGYLDSKQLYAMALSCTRLNAVCHRSLYRTIDFVWDKEDPASALSPRRFLCAILRRPELALLVENISFRALNWSKIAHLPNRGYAEPEDRATLPNNDVCLVHTLIEDLQLPDAGRWKEEFAKGSAVVPIALILSQISNVKSLTIDAEFQWDKWRHLDDYKPHLLGILLRHTVQAPSCVNINRFPHLKEVKLSTNVEDSLTCQEWPVDPEQIWPFFYAPCLETAEVKMDTREIGIEDGDFRTYENPIQWPDHLPKATSLRTLRLLHGRFTERNLVSLLSPFTNLKNLEYSYECEGDTGREPPNRYGFNGELIKQALRPCASSLEHLRITTSKGGFGEWSGIEDLSVEWIYRPIGSLKDFPVLKTLDICLVFLLGQLPKKAQDLSDVLPSSLEELRINDDLQRHLTTENYRWQDGATAKLFRRFLAGWRETTPHLRKIDVFLGHSEETWLEDKRAAFVAMCERAGVECEIDKPTGDYEDWDTPPFTNYDSDGNQHIDFVG